MHFHTTAAMDPASSEPLLAGATAPDARPAPSREYGSAGGAHSTATGSLGGRPAGHGARTRGPRASNPNKGSLSLCGAQMPPLLLLPLLAARAPMS